MLKIIIITIKCYKAFKQRVTSVTNHPQRLHLCATRLVRYNIGQGRYYYIERRLPVRQCKLFPIFFWLPFRTISQRTPLNRRRRGRRTPPTPPRHRHRRPTAAEYSMRRRVQRTQRRRRQPVTPRRSSNVANNRRGR